MVQTPTVAGMDLMGWVQPAFKIPPVTIIASVTRNTVSAVLRRTKRPACLSASARRSVISMGAGPRLVIGAAPKATPAFNALAVP